ncbi:SKP1-like protein 1B [Cinnamomum micranthum f. kanehirae]|uniref:SKP1-like protein 1B n=1 Tax=Cinnamomum micranthum f. kanehirae TaxID=337451 RepID=A0A3S3NCT6_9MAGN|nr:SKP1-like protein 1B [Cinnamomum micranthum f. kanehirae]
MASTSKSASAAAGSSSSSAAASSSSSSAAAAASSSSTVASSSSSATAAASSSAVASSSSSKVIVLMSMEGERFEVEDYVARESKIISNMMEDDCANNDIPVPNVMASILSKIIEWCKKHAEIKEDNNHSNEEKEKELRSWDKEFVDLDTDTLYYLVVAANYLDINGLLDLLCQKVADMIKGKNPEQIREIFNIKNDFTPEEEEAIRKENSWAFESA